MCQGHRRFLGLSRRQTVRSRKQTHPATAGPSACACPAALNQAADTTPKSQNRPTTGLVRAGPDPAAVATTFAPIAEFLSMLLKSLHFLPLALNLKNEALFFRPSALISPDAIKVTDRKTPPC